ncbi:hypothetical protein D3C72_1398370 [compost metagenome]
MHHGAELVEGDAAIGGDADREHQQVAEGRAAFDHCTVERQVHRLAGGRVGQPGGSGHHAQCIAQGARTISAKRRGEVGGEALGGVGRQHRFVHHQGRFHAGGTDARPIVVEDDLGADFGFRNRGLDQRETTDIKVGVLIALGIDGRTVLDKHAVVIRRSGVFNLVAGFNAGEGCDPCSKADGNGRIIHRSV